MKIFITGGTGFIGRRLAEKLVTLGHEVIMLIRDPSKVTAFKSDKTTYIKGDIFDLGALNQGMAGCDWVFHLAAFTKPWSKDPSQAYRTNVTGTINVIETAINNSVKRVIITSTAGTMGFSSNGHPINEDTNTNQEYQTLYDKTKAEAEKKALHYSKKGVEIIITNPSRIYGPGRLSKSNSLTKIIKWYSAGLWRIIPGKGNSIGNYVYIDDVVDGHILAAQSGRNGERYILGGENLTFIDLFRKIGEATGSQRRLFHLSLRFIRLILKLSILISGITGIPPIITEDWINKYVNDAILSSDKAINELGYRITPFSEGVRETLNWLNTKKTWRKTGRHMH